MEKAVDISAYNDNVFYVVTYNEEGGEEMKTKLFIMLICFFCSVDPIHSAQSEVYVYVYTDDQKPIPHARFSLYQDEVCVLYDIESDETGKIVLSDLESGTYVLKQDTTMEGYDANNEQSFTYTKGKTLHLKDIINKRLYGTLTIQLLDHQHHPLPNTPFTISSGDIKRTYTSDQKGYAHITKLPIGTYELTQKEGTTEFAITQGNYDQTYILQVCVKPQIIEKKHADASLWILSGTLMMIFLGGFLYLYRTEFVKASK